MGRQAVVDALVLSLQQVTRFTEDELGVAIADDHRVLQTGVSQAVIVLNDRFEARKGPFKRRSIDWVLAVEVWTQHTLDVVQARRDSNTNCQAVVDRLEADPLLGGACNGAVVESGQVQDEKAEIAGGNWLVEVLAVRVSEY